jgi:hypothetical protein
MGATAADERDAESTPSERRNRENLCFACNKPRRVTLGWVEADRK